MKNHATCNGVNIEFKTIIIITTTMIIKRNVYQFHAYTYFLGDTPLLAVDN